MADKTDDLVIGVSTDMAAVQRAMKRLDSDIARTSGQIEKRFSSLGRSIDNSMTTAMQARIDAMTGVATKATKEWTGALAQQGQEMDRLRAKFSPVFSTITSYKSSINEIRTAHRLGAISTDEMTAAIQRERQAALASIAAIKGRNAALADTPPVMGGAIGQSGNAFQTANIAAQFQDIAVMTQMGIANPLTMALQQGTQLSAVFNTMGGAKDVIRGIGTAFLSIVNPVSLVTIGTIAAGVAAYNYFSESEDGAEATAEALKEQANLIQSVAQKWGDALPAIRAYADEQDRLAGNADAATAFKKLADETFGKIKEEVSSAGNAIQDVMGLLQTSVPTDQIVAVQRSLANLSATAAENKTTVADMDAAHAALMDAFRSSNIPILSEAADAIAALRPELVATTAEMARIAEEKRVTELFNNLQAAIGKIDSAKARDELRTLMDQAKEGEISVADLMAELARISGYAPDVSGIISAFLGVANAANAARAAASDPMWTAKPSQGGRSRYSTTGSVFLPNSAPTPTERPNDIQRLDWQAEAEERAARSAKRGGGSKAPRRTPDDRFFEDIEAIKQRTIALAEEQAQLGLSYEAQQKRRIAFDLEQKALKDVREAARQKGEQDWQNATLSAEQIKQIDEVSAAYARQAAELQKAQEQSAFAEDALYGLFTDLVPAIETGNKALDNFLAKLIEVGLQAALLGKGPLGGLFGGGLLNMGGGILGGGAPILNAGGGFASLIGYSQGTANTGGQRGQPMGIVHGQEAVIPLPNGGRVPVQISTPVAPSFSGANQSGPAITYAPVYHVAEGADPRAIAELRQAQAKDRAEFSSRVLSTVSRGQKARHKF